MEFINRNTIKDENRTEKFIIYILAPLTVLAILLLVYALKGIYPFGKETVDYYDMSQEVVAVYYHIFDYLHGNKVPFIDWYTGLGMNMYNGTSGSNIFDPFNILLLLFKRERLLEGMSFLLAIKLMLMSVSFGYFLRKIYENTNAWLKYSLSIGYALCGFVMMHYTIMPWLDTAILFPILITCVIRLLKEGKVFGYTLVMTLMLITNYYLSAMALIYIFCGSGLYMLAAWINQKNKETTEAKTDFHLMELGITTVISFLLSSFALIPQIMQVLSSTRFENNGGYLEAIKTITSPYPAKIWAVLGIALPLVYICKGLFSELVKNKCRNKGSLVWVVGMLIISCMELFVEGNNLLLHFGSYVHYPIRNGFILYFTIAAIAAYYETTLNKNDKAKDFIAIVATVIGIASASIVIYVYANKTGKDISAVIRLTKILGLAYFFFFLALVNNIGNKRKYLIALLGIAQLIIYSYIFIGPVSFYADYMNEPEQEAEYIRISNQCVDEMDLAGELTKRIKNPDTSLNSNYGFVMKRATLSNMTHLVMKEAQDGAASLGYSIMFTRLLDVGGTELTDAMLGVNNIITRMDFNDDFYELLDSASVVTNHITGEKTNYNYYKRKYTLPFTMIIKGEEDINKLSETTDIVSFHNDAYKGLQKCVSDEEAGEIAELTCAATEGQTQIHLDGDKLLYFWGGCADQEFSSISIRANGEQIVVPTIKDYENIKYPSHFNNNILYIGEYHDEDVNIDIEIDEQVEEKANYAGFFTIDAKKLAELCSMLNEKSNLDQNEVSIEANRVSANVKAQEGNYLLLPIAYNKGFKAKVNGTEVNTINVRGLFSAIRLEQGQNQIELIYYPEGFWLGIAISIAGVAMLGLLLVLARKRIFENTIILRLESILAKIYFPVWVLVILAVYVIPAFANIIFRFV